MDVFKVSGSASNISGTMKGKSAWPPSKKPDAIIDKPTARKVYVYPRYL